MFTLWPILNSKRRLVAAGTELVKGMLVQDGCDGEIGLSMEGYATEDPEGIIDQVRCVPTSSQNTFLDGSLKRSVA